jgi:hypothetical protein
VLVNFQMIGLDLASMSASGIRHFDYFVAASGINSHHQHLASQSL